MHTLESALARIAELETELASRPKRRAPRKPAQQPCQYCGDTKTDKLSFIGLPLCKDWRPCASRIRRMLTAGTEGAYAMDKRYRVTPMGDLWALRFNGEAIDLAPTQAAARQAGYAHWTATREQVAA